MFMYMRIVEQTFLHRGFLVLLYQLSLSMKLVKYLRNTDIFEVSSLVYIHFLNKPAELTDE